MQCNSFLLYNSREKRDKIDTKHKDTDFKFHVATDMGTYERTTPPGGLRHDQKPCIMSFCIHLAYHWNFWVLYVWVQFQRLKKERSLMSSILVWMFMQTRFLLLLYCVLFAFPIRIGLWNIDADKSFCFACSGCFLQFHKSKKTSSNAWIESNI